MSTPADDRAPAFQAAVSYLEDIGFQVKDQDWHLADGNLDIVAADQGTLVACVLKAAAGQRYGTALDAVSGAAAARLRHLAACWLAAHRQEPAPVRIDVLGVIRDGAGGFTIEHVRGVG